MNTLKSEILGDEKFMARYPWKVMRLYGLNLWKTNIFFKYSQLKGVFWHQNMRDNITLHLCLRDDEQPSQLQQSAIPATETAAFKADVAAWDWTGKTEAKDGHL